MVDDGCRVVVVVDSERIPAETARGRRAANKAECMVAVMGGCGGIGVLGRTWIWSKKRWYQWNRCKIQLMAVKSRGREDEDGGNCELK